MAFQGTEGFVIACIDSGGDRFLERLRTLDGEAAASAVNVVFDASFETLPDHATWLYEHLFRTLTYTGDNNGIHISNWDTEIVGDIGAWAQWLLNQPEATDSYTEGNIETVDDHRRIGRTYYSVSRRHIETIDSDTIETALRRQHVKHLDTDPDTFEQLNGAAPHRLYEQFDQLVATATAINPSN